MVKKIEIIGIDHDDESVVIEASHKKKVALITAYSVIGRLKTHDSSEWGVDKQNIDLVDLMHALPNIATRTLKEIKDNMTYTTNESRLPIPKSNSIRNSRSSGLRYLKKLNVIKKLGLRHFIINPYCIVPPPEMQAAVIEKWNSVS